MSAPSAITRSACGATTQKSSSPRACAGDTPAVACDHYHRHAEDVRDLAALGVDDYRFSISWSRVLPTGRGRVNRPGLDFYSRLVDDLLAAGIRPVPTLYHWDLPQALQDEGGWLSRDTSQALADYTAVVVDALGDRVTRWLTLNEMNVHTLYGHGLTDHAPALGMGLDCLPVAHNLLRAHGLAVEAIRAAGPRHEVGVVQQHFPVIAATDSPEDVGAAEMFRILTNWLFSDPVLRGAYPEDWVAELVMTTAGLTADQLEQDLVVIASPLDHYGVNYYEPTVIESPRPDADYAGVLEVDFPEDMPFRPVRIEGVERTDFEWAAGYAERFGLVHVDHSTLTRTRKDSWYWYRDLIDAHRNRVAGNGPTRASGTPPAV
ncbi:family 1 glycosylhydrolase [Dietzia cercidiphylli]|nr:family 1 glycosylhydrolase [Dietzia cercidiphylli]